MCYLKNLKNEENFDFNNLVTKSQEISSDCFEEDSNILIPCDEK